MKIATIIAIVLALVTGQAIAAPTPSDAAARPTATHGNDGHGLKVSVKPAGTDQVRVSWSGITSMKAVAVFAGSEGALREHPFHTAFLPGSTTSVTLTVPAKYRTYLGTGSGNPIFIKVAGYHSTSSKTPRAVHSPEPSRISPAGVYTYAGHAEPEGAALRVAEWNVNSVAGSRNDPGYTWADRRKKVAAGIVTSGADLLATAELTTATTRNGDRQWEDLANLLKPHGYRIANDPGPAGKNATKGAHLFYRTAALDRLGGGMISPKSLKIGWPGGLTDRYASWAQFRQKSSGIVFYAVAVHFPADSKSHSYQTLRVAEARAIDTMISAKAGDATVIMAGDFNSSFLSHSKDPASTLHSIGYYDSAAASKRSNPRISTANITRQVDNKTVRGYPHTPYRYKYPAPRIDYIMAKNSPGSTRYVNQVIVRGNGTFTPKYHGSDHNLQWTDLVIRPPMFGWLRCDGACAN